MTRQRYDNNSTEFGLWLREQREIDSGLGFVATNLDYVWENYKTGEWMLIEEKRHMGSLTYSQRKQFARLHKALKGQPGYKGFHLLVFEVTSPDDGRIFLNGKQITRERLIRFLRFEEYHD